MTGNPVLARYVSEVASRCGLILALYSRPHSSECAVSEHRAIIAALASGDATRASALMDQHLDAVADRALIVSSPRKGARHQGYFVALCGGDCRPAKARANRRLNNSNPTRRNLVPN